MSTLVARPVDIGWKLMEIMTSACWKGLFGALIFGALFVVCFRAGDIGMGLRRADRPIRFWLAAGGYATMALWFLAAVALSWA